MFVLPFALEFNEYHYLRHNCQGTPPTPDGYLAFFAMAHVVLSGITGTLCRVQLHGLSQLEARGYARFCRSQRRLVSAPVYTAVVGE